MRKKIISVILGLFVGASSFLVFFVPSAQAVVPIGFAQAALASYVSSTGYKMYQDQAVGDSILQSLSGLYDLFCENTLQGAATDFALDTLLASFQIRQDNSGNVVISKTAADVFQQFSDWLQTEYNIPDNSDIPTEVIEPTTSGIYTNSYGSFLLMEVNKPYTFNADPVSNSSYSSFTFTVTSGSSPVYFWRRVSNQLPASAGAYYFGSLSSFGLVRTITNGNGQSSSSAVSVNHSGNPYHTYWVSGQGYNVYPTMPIANCDVPPLRAYFDDLVATPGVAGLGLSIAQTVVDQAAKAGEDDAVVIGVGAQAGATAQEIADLIAQGINARTLDPSVTVVAEVAIDTPVQQFPDQDDLGLPKLGLALVRRFPFCIPFDLVDTWQAIVHAPVPPTMTIDLIPASIKAKIGITADTSFILNLASPAFATLLFILRWACIISFCLALEQLTKRYIWTTGG